MGIHGLWSISLLLRRFIFLNNLISFSSTCPSSTLQFESCRLLNIIVFQELRYLHKTAPFYKKVTLIMLFVKYILQLKYLLY